MQHDLGPGSLSSCALWTTTELWPALTSPGGVQKAGT